MANIIPSQQQKSQVLQDAATLFLDISSIHFVRKVGTPDDYQTALTFCTPRPSLLKDAQLWPGPQARCQTISLPESPGRSSLIPQYARFSRESTVFVALGSDRIIRCWTRTRDQHRGPDLPYELGWNQTQVFGPVSGAHDISEDLSFRFTLSAAGNTMAYCTSFGIGVCGTETGDTRHLKHPPKSSTELKFLTLSEDGSHLAACYAPEGSGSVRVWVWSVASICNPTHSVKSPGLHKRVRKRLEAVSPLITRIWPLNHTSLHLQHTVGNKLAGMAFSPTGDRLAILSLPQVGDGSNEFSDTNGVSYFALHTWDTTTWKSTTSTFRSRKIPSPAGAHDHTDTECLNFTFSSGKEIAILWQSHSHSSGQYSQQVEFLDLAHTDGDVETTVVDLPFNALSEVHLNPEPFWIEGDNIHVSHGYFRKSSRDSKADESLCFYKNFKVSDEHRRAFGRSGISQNDLQFLWSPWAYSDDDLFVCGRNIFAMSESKSGTLKFVEMTVAEDERTGQ